MASSMHPCSTPASPRPASPARDNNAFGDPSLLQPPTVVINSAGARIMPETANRTEANDIYLPNHTEDVSHIAVDIGLLLVPSPVQCSYGALKHRPSADGQIGGSLAKVVYFTRDTLARNGGRLHFAKFETVHIDQCITFLQTLITKRTSNVHQETAGQHRRRTKMVVMATGGGAFKYYDRIRDALGVEIIREDEMACLIVGLDFFIQEIPGEVFTCSEDKPIEFVERPQGPSFYPYLLVNIGSGVSMIKVSGPEEFERIGGSSLGGGMLWGLLSLLTGAQSFDEMLVQSKSGDNTKVDMLVGDIYGQDYSRIGLKSTTIASTFGKVFRRRQQGEDPSSFRAEDISKSLLYAISNNIGQIAYLQAQRFDLEHIYFGGSFIRGHTATMITLSYAINFWSKATKQAYFLQHEGYLGSVGAFLRHQPRIWTRRFSNPSPTSSAIRPMLKDTAAFETSSSASASSAE